MIIKHYCYRMIEKIFRKRNIIITYFTKVGLKNINMGSVAKMSSPYIIERKIIAPSDLYLGPDFLTDEFTLLGCSIVNSPHCEFVRSYVEGKNVLDTEYAQRWEAGTLDWRRPMPVSVSLDEWKKTAALRIKEITDDKYDTVKVYYHDGKYYVYDGKHRAALCAVMEKNVLCDVIPTNYILGYYGGYMLDRVKNNAKYTKHRDFLGKMR